MSIDIPVGMGYAMHGHARRLRMRFPMCEHDDIVQEMTVWWYEHPRTVRRYLDDEDDQRGERQLSAALRNAGLAYCHKEKARALGYELDDLFFYSLPLLRELLPGVYDPEAWRRVGQSAADGMPRGRSAPNEGNNIIACLSDVSRALKGLPAEPKHLIELTFRDGMEPDRLAVLLNTTEDAARMRVQRALRRLQERLGGERPDWAAASHDGIGPDEGEHDEL